MNKRLKFVLGGSAIAVAVLYLIVSGTTESVSYYLTVTEAAHAGTVARGAVVRVKGRVRKGSSKWDSRALRLSFTLADDQQEIPVSYHGVVPDLFAEGREIIVEGQLSPTGLVADSLLASCPSKYEPADSAAHTPP
jgi:cytochrome c-type biogenesis protein CcmE